MYGNLIENVEAEEHQKRAAYRDAKIRSAQNQGSCPLHASLAGQRMFAAMKHVHGHECSIYLNYRKRCVTVKVSHPGYCFKQAELDFLEEGYAKAGYKKKISAQGVIYSIPHKVH